METDIAMSNLARAETDGASMPTAVAAVTSFTADLYRSLAAQPGNLVCSPYSVAVALTMARNGARGSTAREMDAVLQAPRLADLNAGLNALTRHLDTRAGDRQRADRTTAHVSLTAANSVWGQAGTDWEAPFLDALAHQFGAGLRLVNYVSAAEAAGQAINDWTSQQTAGAIPAIVPAGALDPMTRLVLVNAIHFKAPWEEPFDEQGTHTADFTRSDDSRVRVPMMRQLVKSARHASGPGWQAVDLRYAGSQLAMAVVVADPGRLAELERGLTGAELSPLLRNWQTSPVALSLPRWKFRTRAGLGELLAALGMPTALSEDADFTGITTQERLRIDAVLHEAYVAVDEEGTEAAAATAVLMEGISRPQYVPFTADRPFLFVIHDVESATPLLIGRVEDPSTG